MVVVVIRTVRMVVTVSVSMPVFRPVVVIRSVLMSVAQPMTELGFVTIPWSAAVAGAVIWSVVVVGRTAVCDPMAISDIRNMAVRLGIPDFVTMCMRNDPPPFGIALVTHSATA